MAMRTSYVPWVVGAGVLIGSFLITFCLTEPITGPNLGSAPPNKEAEVLPPHLVPNKEILSGAATAAGLHRPDKLSGNVAGVTRLNKDQVRIGGWAADSIGQGTPITVLVFADGKNVFATQTKGARSDVANALKLSDAAAANVAFGGVLSCSPRQSLFVVAVTQGNLYAMLGHSGPLVCPG